MQLVSSRFTSLTSFTHLSQLRDLGQRLEHLVARYDRLAREMLCDAVPLAELQSRMRLVEREIGVLTLSLQEALVARHETVEPVTVGVRSA